MTKSERNTELHYIHKDIESKWRDRWSKDNLYEVKDDDPRTKWYELTMYPYPSGDLHVGHWYAMIQCIASYGIRCFWTAG
jgi:leucyl-tRNA synthetase